MSENTLYIIGNGFDLAHGLPTRYDKDLSLILEYMDEDFFQLVNDIYFNSDFNLWSEFENRVGLYSKNGVRYLENEMDAVLMEYHSMHSDPYSDDYPPDSENAGDKFTPVDIAIDDAQYDRPKIDEIFRIGKKLNGIMKFLDKGMQTMIWNANNDIFKKKQLGKFKKSSSFISFNYTLTLEQLYGINEKKIFHVHGTDDMIWGKSQDKEVNIDIKLNFDCADFNIDDYKSEFDEKTGQYYTYPDNIEVFGSTINFEDVSKDIKSEIESELQYISDSFNKSHNLEGLEKFLNGKTPFSNVIVLGHSIGDVDICYFEKINKKLNNPNWLISYYDKNDVVLENVKKLTFTENIACLPFTELFN